MLAATSTSLSVSSSLTSKPIKAKVLCVPRAYASIQDAVDAANDGDCIALGNGVHTLHEPLLVDKSVHIICGDEGNTGVTIRLDTTSGLVLRPSSHMIVLACSSCRLADLTIEHIGQNSDPNCLTFAIWCRQGSPLLDECKIISSMHSAIGVNEGTFPTFKRCQVNGDEYGAWVGASGRLRLDRCLVQAQKGVYCDTSGIVEVESCKFLNCGVGVECLDTCKVDVRTSSFIDCTEAGVYCTGGSSSHTSHTLSIDTNRFLCSTNNDLGAIKGVIVDGSKPVVHKNTFEGCCIDVRNGGTGNYSFNTITRAAVGAFVSGRSNPSFRQNNFDGCEVAVLVKEKLTQATFISNEFSGNATAVRIMEEANPSFVANIMEESEVGFDFIDSGRGNIRGNDVKKCSLGMKIHLNADPFLEQNQIRECKSGILVEGGKGKLAGNDIIKIEETGCVLSDAHGTWVEDNIVEECGKEGFLILHASEVTLIGNKVHGTKLAAVQCSEDCKTTINMQGNDLQEDQAY